MLTSSPGTNYVLNKHEDVGQYGPQGWGEYTNPEYEYEYEYFA